MAESPTLKYEKNANSEPWAVLIALATVIIVATSIAIVAIFILWKRYKIARMSFERNLVGISFEMPPPERPESQLKEYEVQSLDMYVPQDDREDLGEVHISLSPTTGIQSVHQVKEVPTPMHEITEIHEQSFHDCSLESNSLDIISLNEMNKNMQEEDKLFKRVMHYSKLNI